MSISKNPVDDDDVPDGIVPAVTFGGPLLAAALPVSGGPPSTPPQQQQPQQQQNQQQQQQQTQVWNCHELAGFNFNGLSLLANSQQQVPLHLLPFPVHSEPAPLSLSAVSAPSNSLPLASLLPEQHLSLFSLPTQDRGRGRP